MYFSHKEHKKNPINPSNPLNPRFRHKLQMANYASLAEGGVTAVTEGVEDRTRGLTRSNKHKSHKEPFSIHSVYLRVSSVNLCVTTLVEFRTTKVTGKIISCGSSSSSLI
jgi:hypothetical protein